MSKGNGTREYRRWWAPVWNGLVMDQEAAHFNKMGNALWLYFYLVVNANRDTGQLMRKVRTICSDTGITRRTIERWLLTLRKEGYIHTSTTGRFLTIGISKWKPLGKAPDMTVQTPQSWRGSSDRVGVTQTPSDTTKPAWLKEKLAAWAAPKENTIKENNLKNDIDNKNFEFKNPHPIAFKTREDLLAYDLANALNDLAGFSLYLTLARKYPESILRETLGRVREIPDGEIKTSRGALFNFLIKKHEVQSTFNPRR